jgi:hypothetical protein
LIKQLNEMWHQRTQSLVYMDETASLRYSLIPPAQDSAFIDGIRNKSVRQAVNAVPFIKRLPGVRLRTHHLAIRCVDPIDSGTSETARLDQMAMASAMAHRATGAYAGVRY